MDEINEIKQEDLTTSSEVSESVQSKSVFNLGDTVSPEEAFGKPVETEFREVATKEEIIRDDEAVVDFATDELLSELAEKAPTVAQFETEEETKPIKEEAKPTAIERIAKLVKENEDYDVFGDVKIGGDFEVKDTSVDVVLEKSKPILTNAVALNPEDPDYAEKLTNSISIPPNSPDQVLKYFTENPTALDNDERGIITSSLGDGYEMTGPDFERNRVAATKEGTKLTQVVYLPNNSGKFTSGKIKVPKKGDKLTGIHAKAAIMDALGMSSHYRVVLPHSGLVAVIAAPLPSELIDLQYILDTAKINIGRNYGGSIYGSTTWFISDKIVDLFINKIAKINLKDSSPENIRNLIDPMDIPSIAWGLACAMFPDGYNYNRVALLDNGKAVTVSGKLWLPDMEVFAENKFSTRQKQHLAQAESLLMSNEEILSYRRNWKKEEDVAEFSRIVSERETITTKGKVKKTMSVVLDRSNMVKFTEHGSAWDVYLREAINDTLALVSDENIRSAYLSRKITATSLREYSHYIKEIRIKETYDFSEDEIVSTIDSQDMILEALDEMMLSDDIRNKLMDAINEYISDSTKVIYGVPTVSDYEEKYSTTPVSNKIVPISPVMTFFTLTAQIYRLLGIPLNA